LYCYNYSIFRDYLGEHIEITAGNTLKILHQSEINLKAFTADTSYYNNQGRIIAIAYDKILKKHLFIVKGLLAFSWESGRNVIYYTLFKQGTIELLDYWLLHVFLPIYFSHQKTYFFFHVGALLIQKRVVAFLAPCHGGKSTLTDFFLKQGHTLMCDDKLGTFEKNGTIYAVPSYPYHRPYRAVEDIGIKVNNFANASHEMHAFFVLVQSDADAIVTIKELTGIEKFKQLRYATEMNYSVEILNETAYLTQVANTVQLYKITVPWDINRLDEVYEAILKQMEMTQ
jgi:hypothetical protein